MALPFFGLTIGYRSLSAQQQALDTISHNIANANTSGYSRQESVLVATPPYSVPIWNFTQHSGQLGTGVQVAITQRQRDAFVDSQVRKETLSLGKAEVERDTLRQVEGVYNEPSNTGLSSLLDKFWASWQDLSNDPSSASQRASLREQARALAEGINHAYRQLKGIQSDLNSQIALRVSDVNGISSQIAALNGQIISAQSTGNQPNDLRDQRDLLLDRLAKILPVDTVEAANGQVNVFFQGRALVDGVTASSLGAKSNATNGGNLDLTFDGGATFLTAGSGQIGGLQDARDGEVVNQISSLDALAVALRDAVNTQHRLGFGLDGVTNRDFFSGTGASDLALSVAVEASTDAIAATGTGEGTAGATNAQAIAALQNAVIPIGAGTGVLGDYYRSTISTLGVASESVANTAANQDLLVQNLDWQRQSISGVSLDEETTQMIQYQRAYQAAARVISVTDEMLDKLINGTGVVGR